MSQRQETIYHPPRHVRDVRRGAVSSPPLRPSGGRSSWTTPKRMIWTGAFAAVTIVGTIYGAGLKTQQDYRAEKKQILETPIEERISALEARRAQLMSQKHPLEKKRDELRLRIEKQNQNPPAEPSASR